MFNRRQPDEPIFKYFERISPQFTRTNFPTIVELSCGCPRDIYQLPKEERPSDLSKYHIINVRLLNTNLKQMIEDRRKMLENYSDIYIEPVGRVPEIIFH